MIASWKESYNKPRQYVEKQRHYSADKGPYSQGYMVFPVVMYGCESWTIKKAEHQRIDTFELWGWKRLLKVPWTAITLSIPVNNPEYLLEELMLSNQSITLNIYWKN